MYYFLGSYFKPCEIKKNLDKNVFVETPVLKDT